MYIYVQRALNRRENLKSLCGELCVQISRRGMVLTNMVQWQITVQREYHKQTGQPDSINSSRKLYNAFQTLKIAAQLKHSH